MTPNTSLPDLLAQLLADGPRAGEALRRIEEGATCLRASDVLDRLANAAPTARGALDRLARGETDQ